MLKLLLILLSSSAILSADPGITVEVKVIFPDYPGKPGKAGDVEMHS